MIANFVIGIVTLALSLSFVAPQGNITDGLAPCAVACLNNASAYSGCSEADTDSAIACTCFSPKFQQIIGPCIQSTCDEAASEQLLQDATQLCAAVGGTPVDNAAAISSLAGQPGAAALYTSFEADGLASSRLAMASSVDIAQSLQLEGGITSATSRLANATVAPTGSTPSRATGSASPYKTGTAPIATFTGDATGMKGMSLTVVGAVSMASAVIAGFLI